MADLNSLLMPVPATTATTATDDEGWTTGGGMGDEERMRYIEMKKAELSYRELAVEVKALEVTKAELELERMRVLHELRVQLMEIEISILMRQEDQLQ